jgi:hypothetical protein
MGTDEEPAIREVRVIRGSFFVRALGAIGIAQDAAGRA